MKTTIQLTLLGLLTALNGTGQTLPLSGQWRFQLDREDRGIKEAWFSRKLPQTIRLPGTLTGQGIGNDISTNTPWVGGIVDRSWFTDPQYAPYRQPGNVKVPFWLQPDKYYAGAAWYQRDIEIPEDWADRRVVLFLERAHWETRVWIDDRFVGRNNSLSTPHEQDLGQLTPGPHTLTVRVDNRVVVDIGQNSHGITDHTQGNWNGLVGRIELRSTPLVWIEDLQIYPNAYRRTFRIQGQILNHSGQTGRGLFELAIKPVVTGGSRASRQAPGVQAGVIHLRWPAMWGTKQTTFGWDIPPEDVAGLKLWDEFSPNLYQATVTLPGGGHSRTVRFGLRDIATDGTQITINGRKTFLRGTLECAIFPRTGHPPMEVTEWERIIRAAKACGLNHLRFHSWCPPEAAFRAADELGMYFHVETCWPNQTTRLGDGRPVDQWVRDETDRILKSYGNHPSFVMMAHGNEPGGRNASAYLQEYVAHYKKQDPRRLWTSGSGWPELAENQYHVTPKPRIQQWGQGLRSRINARPPETTTDYREFISARNVPVVSHEIGQWCVYPNFDEIPKYTGYLKPKNFEIFRDQLAANGMLELARPFLIASGKLQALCYKEEIESALRTPGMGGFQLLDLHDFPGQGTALVGVLDPFWEEKGYITKKDYSRFCNATVPLARLPKRVFTATETLEAEIQVSHFGSAPLKDAVLEWKLIEGKRRVRAKGEFPARTIPTGGVTSLGHIAAELGDVRAPAACQLVVGIAGTRIENDWDVWVYPESATTSAADKVLLSSSLDDVALARLKSGGSVLLTLPGKRVRNYDKHPVALGFSSIFWNTAWTHRQAPTTLGLLCDPKHPALRDFPTDSHSNWQWWYLVHRAGALRLDLLPSGIEPIVRVIDDWVTARPLGLIIEARVGAGKVIVCGFDLTRDTDDPVSPQMRASLLNYMTSRQFKPTVNVSPDQLQQLIAEQGGLGGKGATARTDSAQSGYEADQAIDGNPNTFWHTAWEPGVDPLPHELVVALPQSRRLAGITALPRQDGNRNGWIKDYEIYVADSAGHWGDPVARGRFDASASRKSCRFEEPVSGRVIRLVVTSGHADGQWASLAELGIIQ